MPSQAFFIIPFFLLIFITEFILNQKWSKLSLGYGFFVSSSNLDIDQLNLSKLEESRMNSQYEKLDFRKVGNEIYFRINFGYMFSNRGSIFLKLTTGKIIFDTSLQQYVVKFKLMWAIYAAVGANILMTPGLFNSDLEANWTNLALFIGFIVVLSMVFRIFFKKYKKGLVDLLNSANHDFEN
jgi:hypothetical protein